MSTFNIPTILVIFGATGDLVKKKIFPALYHLYTEHKLPEKFKLVGVARREFSDEKFRLYIKDILHQHHIDITKEERINSFLETASYQQGHFENLDDYKKIASILGRNDDYWSICSNKLFYLAVSPTRYEQILHYLADSKLTEPCSPEEGWTRVLIEKPLGKDASSAEKIEELLASLFKEEQIYRIDHYLAKQMIQNVLTFRFANTFLEQSWNSKNINKIDVKFLEDIGVETRGAFYDHFGALRDVGQNHLLQMLAMVTMDRPTDFDCISVRRERAKLLNKINRLSVEEAQKQTFRAQYEGYKDIDGVDLASSTETYFKLKTSIDSARWYGVPIFLEAGKKMSKRIIEIVVSFKQVHRLPADIDSDTTAYNRVRFSVDPEEITISFLSKKPHISRNEMERKEFKFTYRNPKTKKRHSEEYAKVLLDCIRGDQLLFISTSEVRAMWQFIDPILDTWNKQQTPLHLYSPQINDIREQATDFLTKTATSSLKKEIGIIGLGKMGGNIAKQLAEKNWHVYGYNRTASVTDQLKSDGIRPSYSLEELVSSLSTPRVIWLMVPAGKPVESTIFGDKGLLAYLEPGDIIIEAGNSFYKDTVDRARRIESTGVHFVDAGVSGGPAGARYGACVMVGGNKHLYEYLFPLFEEITVAEGTAFFPGQGAGHFVKMVHNGIEYGMMQALAEGFAVMKASDYNLDLEKVAHLYNHGSVIESSLVGWMEQGFQTYGQDLKTVSGSISHSGEGLWTVETAKELGIPVKNITQSLQFRIDSQQKPSFTGQLVSVLRNMFGGHNVKKE